MNILMVASEAAPLAKTGGLADMVSGLSSALVKLGHDVRILVPGYAGTVEQVAQRERVATLTVQDGASVATVGIDRVVPKGQAVDTPPHAPTFYLVQHDGYFGRRGMYQDSGRDYPDNLARFALFSRAALALVRHWAAEKWSVDVIHAHDWQAALVPFYLKVGTGGASILQNARTVLTLHNVGYQGLFPADQYSLLGVGDGYFTPQHLEFYGQVNLLKAGIVSAGALTTVSPTYCREIQTQEFGFGLVGVFRERREQLVGIVNGIDTELWNPETDPWLPAQYSAENLQGKALCKTALQRECGWEASRQPLFAVVSRLVSQKGIDLLVAAVPKLVADGGQLVALGSGDADLVEALRQLERRFPQSVKAFIGFDEGLAHRIQAGADAFLVPSRYEPCGLTQLCSLRYGTVPIVRNTGGLADTVRDSSTASPDRPATGFVFDRADSADLSAAMSRALLVYQDQRQWTQLVLNGMREPVGWDQSAKAYADVYTN
ncbi:MAG: glycogen synthase GlgA [Nitrospiraceae bacterium]